MYIIYLFTFLHVSAWLSFQVRWVLSTPKTFRLIGYAKLPLGVNEPRNVCMTGILQ